MVIASSVNPKNSLQICIYFHDSHPQWLSSGNCRCTECNIGTCCVCVCTETPQLCHPCAALARHISSCSPCPIAWSDVLCMYGERIKLLWLEVVLAFDEPVASCWWHPYHVVQCVGRADDGGGNTCCCSISWGWFCFLLLPRVSFFMLKLPVPREVSGGYWTISRAGQFPGSWWGARRFLGCFEMTKMTMCASAWLLLALLLVGLSLACRGEGDSQKNQMQPKPVRATVVVIEIFREKLGRRWVLFLAVT